ncbi:MAG: hypothetical protein ACYSWP_00575 [Planctomycetota bacterium]|jgi:hypothetical protein
MAKTSRNIVVVASVVLCAAFLAGIGAGPTTKALGKGREQSEEQMQDQYQDSRILVEAFVVQVKLEALYKAGVSPVGSKPNAISIDNILHCLKDPGSAQVTSGAKVAVRHKQEGSIRQQTTKMVKRTTTMGGKNQRTARTQRNEFNNYKAGLTFSIEARVQSQQRVAVGFSFSQADYDFSEPNMPPGAINRDWSGKVSLELGQPSIVGSTQSQEEAAILILCADIKNQ